MSTLVTGGSGFIGSHLVEALLSRGEQVIVLDDLSTGSAPNLSAVADHPALTLVQGSVLDEDLVSRLTDLAHTVYHLAAAVGVHTILDHPLDSLRTNLVGTENVVQAAHRRGCRLLVASTSEVYGKNATVGLREEDDRILGSPLKSRWSYAEAKAIDEMLAYTYAVEYNLPVIIVRLFNTVGPRQSSRYGMVIPRFVSQALAGEALTVYGSGEQIRCFCHVGDVIPAMIKLMADPTAYGRVYNLGSDEQVTIAQLAKLVIEATGSTSGITYVPYEIAYGAGYEDMQRRVPNCQRAREQIGFAPRYRLRDIVEAVVASQRATTDPAPPVPIG